MRYYYKDKNGNYYNYKSEHFMIDNIVDKTDENGKTYQVNEPYLDKNYTQITEDEWNQHCESIEPSKPTEEQLARFEKIRRINDLKNLLSSTDYKAIKYAEGLISESEYAPIKAERQGWRDEINALEQSISN